MRSALFCVYAVSVPILEICLPSKKFTLTQSFDEDNEVV